MPVLYDPKRPALSMLRWRGTIWEIIVKNPWFYFFIMVDILFICLRQTQVLPKESAPTIPTSSLAVVGSFVAFAIVFFLNTVYTRFQNQTFLMVQLGGGIYNLVTLSTAIIVGETAEERCMQIARYSNLLFHVCFYSIGKVENYDYLINTNFITSEEVEILKDFRGKKTNLISSWILDVTEQANQDGHVPANCHSRLKECTKLIFQIRGGASILQDYNRFPVPLGYFHFLVVGLYSWLLLLAYSTPYLAEDTKGVWISFLIYFLILISFMGLVGVANEHCDPFGEDPSDVDIITEMDNLVRQTKYILMKKFHPVRGAHPNGNNFKSIPCIKNKKKSSFRTPELIKTMFRQKPAVSEISQIIQDKHSVRRLKTSNYADTINEELYEQNVRSHWGVDVLSLDNGSAKGGSPSVGRLPAKKNEISRSTLGAFTINTVNGQPTTRSAPNVYNLNKAVEGNEVVDCMYEKKQNNSENASELAIDL